MQISKTRFSVLAAVLGCSSLMIGGSASVAQVGPTLVIEPADAPELLPPGSSAPFMVGEPVSYEEIAPPMATEVKAIPVAKIDVDVTRRARKLFGGSPMVELTMVTQNPADGCFYEIPFCLPACCTGEPKVESKCGLMGRGVVKYCYECGLEVEVKFRLRGDVEVEYGT
jgi:hypothetical protein